ncbi:MAG: alginate export family protein [Pseudomonadota bacterium]
MRSFRYTLLSASLAMAVTPSLQAEEVKSANSLKEMVSEGTASLDFRYRYEYVDQANFSKNAKANTLRSRLKLVSAPMNGVSFLVEFSDVTDFGNDFNSTNNGQTDFPVVADPEGTEINQAFIKYATEGFDGIAGRQAINLGNQRFIGTVGWRQNEQTYDGGRIVWTGDTSLKVDLSYIGKVNRIFGPDDGPVQPAELKGDNLFARVDWGILENQTLTGFAYLLDIDDVDKYPAGRSVDNSTDTYGIAYMGKFGPLGARASYATQSDAGDSNLNYDADYYVVEGTMNIADVVKATVGYEVLGADNGVGFKTPYATLHKFQGWADKFLVTPPDGIEDAYIGLAGKLGPVALAAIYHDFQAEDSSADFGTEIDLSATWPVHEMVSLQLKYADFDSDDSDRFDDTEKFWVTVHVKI